MQPARNASATSFCLPRVRPLLAASFLPPHPKSPRRKPSIAAAAPDRLSIAPQLATPRLARASDQHQCPPKPNPSSTPQSPSHLPPCRPSSLPAVLGACCDPALRCPFVRPCPPHPSVLLPVRTKEGSPAPSAVPLTRAPGIPSTSCPSAPRDPPFASECAPCARPELRSCSFDWPPPIPRDSSSTRIPPHPPPIPRRQSPPHPPLPPTLPAARTM